MKKRNEVDINETWAIEELFESDEVFLDGIEDLKKMSDIFVKKYKECNSSDQIYEALEAYSEIAALTDRLSTFASITTEVDTSNSSVMKRFANFANEMSKIDANLSFFESMLAKTDKSLLEETKTSYPEYKYYIDRVIDNSKYLLSDETEKVLANLIPTFDAPYKSYSDIRYADMDFEDFEYDGEEIVLNHNTFEEFLEADPRDDLRREAFKRYHDVLRKYQNSDASVYTTHVENEKRISDIRGYDTVFDYLLSRQDVDKEIYENHIDTIMEELAPHMRKYAGIIKGVYGLDEMTYADLKLAIDPEYEPEVTIDGAREYIIEGLSNLGEEYGQVLNRAFDERWIDYAQNIGKRTGAFASGPYGSHPFIMTTYNNKMSQVMTLAHELGHAGQYYYSNSNQNALNNDMSMYFVEAPSTANEITMERFLLNKASDDREKLWVLATMISKTYYHNFVTHFIEAAFQREVYRKVEAGESLSADDLNQIFTKKLEEFWGDSVKLVDGSELTWMRQPHYYMGLYPYTYQAGLTIGTVISDKIVNGSKKDVDTWIDVLKLGGSVGPIDLAKAAGVDMTNTKAISETVAFIGSLVDQIDELCQKLGMYK
ncbi:MULTISPECIES: oligoendopeptidase F [Anaerococcus]|uniref:Oligopeptidase F n=1 Tax=Anaerococcus nagyae TaxID=1755241 RepID=A0A3E2TLB3_9FIRM|nr:MULTISPECIES: oligoendopeptidase F [Anaerococcus]MBP2069208.1 oligoendopeptidase F [Anaerococcus nagyae]MDU1828820.1 oligoendopeptidase F [Anaerococcus sp.]MDU1865183.1 oligoendopeptidase F [Anaerococcus sp.]MDU2565129.1 oligoendopeptidase F [Anaerococcus sp.]RGB78159.1 oligoendopeptidase F [Anaerococcus nagyae]